MIRFLRIGCNAGSVFSLQYVQHIERHFFAECLSYVLRRGVARRVEPSTTYLVKTLALGGVGDAVALDVEDAVLYVLAGGGVGRVRLVGPVGRGSAYNLQL